MKMTSSDQIRPASPPDESTSDGSELLKKRTTGPDGKGPATGTFSRTARYLIARILTISITIFVGVFITVVIANRGGQIDAGVQRDVDQKVANEISAASCWFCDHTPEQQAHIDQLQLKYEQQAGLHLSFLPRHLLWTVKALSLGLGYRLQVPGSPSSFAYNRSARDLILADLPHSLLLVGTAILLVFLIGIPLSLFLYRKNGGRIEHFFSILTPISSIPSWVLGIILVLIFAAGLRWLPPSGMFDTVPPANIWGELYMIVKHMILPVLAITLSLLLQSVYTWKTFFLLNANEDYVDLAKAKGLPEDILERRYILQPTLPVIITNFTLMMVNFWQMTIALEYIFNWPGIGRLYIMALPNFNGENLFQGVMPVVIGIVVIFAYLLGFAVLILDIVYGLVDPRVRINSEDQTVKLVIQKGWKLFRRRVRSEPIPSVEWSRPTRRELTPILIEKKKVSLAERLKAFGRDLEPLKSVLREIGHYPTAVFGLAIILLLVCGSIVAVTVFPYNQLGSLWYTNRLTGKAYVPKLAQPAWVNWFRRSPLPSTIILDSSKGTAAKTVQPAVGDGFGNITLTYVLNYPYGDYPQDLTLYFTSKFDKKRPFVTMTWYTPDGREIEFNAFSPEKGVPYSLSQGLTSQNILRKYTHWQKWFITDGYNATPNYYLLFSDPTSDKPVVLPGTYTLKINIATFEPDTNVDAELVLLGQVYGWAGTDYMRRDLSVPLLWGMPFALALGLIGASVTTILSMIVAAMGVWYGGWLDVLIQRLIEGIMILPVIAIGVIFYAYFNMNIWTFLALIALLNVFGSPTKTFRAALLQVKDLPYIEAAKASGASNARIILHYLLPNITPVLIPQLVTLIPSYVFLEATLGIFGVKSDYPTWGKVIYEALRHGATYGSGYWVLEPIGLLLLTGIAFAMLGFALERILNPRLRNV
jgi:peptide/nickel transport system permease protein